MGWLAKVVALFVCFAAFSFGFWLVSGLCILYLLVSMWPRKRNVHTLSTSRSPIPRRFIIAGAFALLSIAALGSGGTLSPVLLLFLASAALVRPYLPLSHFLSRVAPKEESILLQSTYFPFAWHCIAEVKPGSEDIPRALSSFSGRLILAKRAGTIYAQTTTWAPDRSAAEASTISLLKEAASSLPPGGAYLFPLDAREACERFRLKLAKVRSGRKELPDREADILVLETEGGFVRKAGACKVVGEAQSEASLPLLVKRPSGSPLLWEVLQAIGKAHPWPEPDSVSNFLQSMVATQGEPIGERLNGLEVSDSAVEVAALGGYKLALSKSQLRAVVAIYS